jgi:carboxyl-terminal processing protease
LTRAPYPGRVRRALIIGGVLVALAGGLWLGGHPDSLPDPVADVFVADSEGQLFDEALGVIEGDFYRRVDRDDVVDQALTAAVDSLSDRFSAYFDPKTYAQFQEATQGEFEGVGMTVEAVPRGLKIVSVFEGSPAAEGDLAPGDVITDVGDESLKGRNVNEATSLIKGPAGTVVTLTVVTGKQRREIEVERRRVEVPVVRSQMRTRNGRKIAHVELDSFTSGAHGAVAGAVRGLLRRGAEGVVLDLRDNGGGLLNEAVLVSSIFIPDGEIVTTRGRTRDERVFEASGRAIDTDIPVVVLVDGESASASEIVTGALQDRDRAEVVGTRTFGKGVFQEITRLSNGGALDLTVGEYFTPDGRNLGPRDGKRGGILPDVKARDDEQTKRDEALDAALRTVVSGAA